MAGKYRVVEIPKLVSPCRNCKEEICNRISCAHLIAFNMKCDHEVVVGYGVADQCDCSGYSVGFSAF